MSEILPFLQAKNLACHSFMMLEEHVRLLDWIQISLPQSPTGVQMGPNECLRIEF